MLPVPGAGMSRLIVMSKLWAEKRSSDCDGFLSRAAAAWLPKGAVNSASTPGDCGEYCGDSMNNGIFQVIAKTLYPILKIALNTLKNCLAVLTSLRILSSVTCARANNFARTRVMSSFRERGVLLYGEAPPERGTTYRLQIYKSVRISNTWKGREICHLGISKGLPSKYCERTLTMGNFLCSPSPISSFIDCTSSV